MRAEFTNRALKDLKRLNVITQKQILKKLSLYLQSPDPLSYAKKLADPTDGNWRFRVGTYRVVFDVSGQTLTNLSYFFQTNTLGWEG
jgi:mRNA interferase RelE/StbE